jgi:FixJ family two-component response regulator
MTELTKVVVVVDDDAGILKSLARFLGVHGFEVRTYSSAEALIDRGDVEAATCLCLI